jgi:hypothetical protein
MKTLRQQCEYLRHQAKSKFDMVRSTWIDCLRWTNPSRASWLLSTTPGERKNHHIVDGTHILAQRSYVAGFLEGNTSASRPWVRIGSKDQARDDSFEAKQWLQHFTERVHIALSSSNFYHAAGAFYYDYSSVNTGAHYFELRENGGFFVHTLTPGSYFVINDSYGDANVLVREFSLNVKAVVDSYGTEDENGKEDWSNISKNVRKMYKEGDYTQMVDIVQVIMENPDYDFRDPDAPNNRQWLELTYEVGGGSKHSFGGNGNSADLAEYGSPAGVEETFLKRFTTRRKPFVVGKSSETFEYGERGPTVDALGIIKSLNKKAIGKDRALEQMLTPTLQGPASLRRSYITSAPNSYIPLDARAMSANQKVESVYQINPAIGAIVQDVGDLRQMVDKFYYADFLLYLSKNPKTRTARETDAIVEEQQRIIGPNLQSLNTTYNIPVLEWVMDYVLFEDPYLLPPPVELEGQSLKPEMISVFAQAQRAADLPSIDRYMSMIMNVGQVNPEIFDKANLDKLADLYEDRLYLPAGLNREQSKVDAKREQAAMMQQRQQALQETLPAVAKAAKDASSAQLIQ